VASRVTIPYDSTRQWIDRLFRAHPSAGNPTQEFIMGKGNKVRKKEVKKPKQDKKAAKK
jgi:hypothetical protein